MGWSDIASGGGNPDSLATLERLYAETKAATVPVPADLSGKKKALIALLGAVSGAVGGERGASQAIGLAQNKVAMLDAAQREARAANLQQEGYAELRRLNIADRMAQLRDKAQARREEVDNFFLKEQSDAAKATTSRGQAVEDREDEQEHQLKIEGLRHKTEAAADEASPFFAKGEFTPVAHNLMGMINKLEEGIGPDGETLPPASVASLHRQIEMQLKLTGARAAADRYSKGLVEAYDSIAKADMDTDVEIKKVRKVPDWLLYWGKPGSQTGKMQGPQQEPVQGDINENDLITALDMIFPQDDAFQAIGSGTSQAVRSIASMFDRMRSDAVRDSLNK